EHVGADVDIEEASAVGGGCISPTARIESGAGPFFLKWGRPDLPAGLLSAEARGLTRLAAAGAVRVPAVVAVAPAEPAEPAWLLLEWLEPGPPGPDAWPRLGRDLARLHRQRADRFGAERDNYIGSLPQRNERVADWADLWRRLRLEPQARQAADRGLLDADDARRLDRLYDRLPELLAPALDDGPSLLHGDLWGGNVHMLADGTPAIIDPSVYHGHREVDLAMAELFGGFGTGFRAAYEEAWPLLPGYAPTRRAVYQLYYLLVHVNLFGTGYVSGTRRALAEAGV
ncbi:MAG: phosphotransferase, partial [Gemmatimonadetes bacterium]|nr:fructosamine kinase family protein [Gemmatimonadota bacterium]NIQ52781.1 fructosamine kinase family protein [Gemmatimonadota bacterium]NIU72911.1 phosphotransferase [Gammaproteobacteria bacterium]NIX43271.1 phosphotransferase [Gemmatimonadota bacterium]NIY07448.1 phosphotransferase [Gemmatimonadota bacterium]